MKKEDKQRFTLRITRANPTELVVILYEMFLCYLEEAQEVLDGGDDIAFREAIRKGRGCLNELVDSLDVRYEPAPALQKLYMYCMRRLALAEAKKNTVMFEDVRKVIYPLRDAYAELAKQNPAGPVMNNTQTVYAGLTYGRNTLTENMTDPGANRGMFA